MPLCSVVAFGRRRDSGELERSFSDLIPIVERGMKKVRSSQVFYAIAFLLCVVALVFTNNLSIASFLNIVVSVARTLLIVYAMFCAWMAVIVSNCQLTALMAAKKDANNTLRTLPAFK